MESSAVALIGGLLLLDEGRKTSPGRGLELVTELVTGVSGGAAAHEEPAAMRRDTRPRPPREAVAPRPLGDARVTRWVTRGGGR